jgi:predicted DNA-binding protein YlxM (UPF0122 family)
MARKNDKKPTSKGGKKNYSPKQRSIEAGKLHEPIIQDRIAGLGVGELVEKYGLSRAAIHAVLSKNAERITQEREEFLKERQEKINKALEDDVENLAELITKSTKLMKTAVEKLQGQIDGGDIKKGTLVMAIDVAIKAFDKVHGIVLAQQKEASKE